ncbi:MAG: IMPACT family protein [Prevotellaceae bacterium]|jgi:uncharacterized YigZ family protein|nr:IMPACT family protein [Prevotellaceae bacterium]
MSDTYYTISAPSEGVYKEKGSRFLAFAYPLGDESEVRQLLTALKKKYYDARHHCFAYRLGASGEIWRASDDGEPSGTGGKPILGQLTSKNLTCVAIFVVRYFGGIKLGVSGLINAYRTAAADAIANAEIIEQEVKDTLTLKYSYDDMNPIMKIIKDMQAEIVEQNFDSECYIKLRIRAGKTQELKSRLSNVDSITLI